MNKSFSRKTIGLAIASAAAAGLMITPSAGAQLNPIPETISPLADSVSTYSLLSTSSLMTINQGDKVTLNPLENGYHDFTIGSNSSQSISNFITVDSNSGVIIIDSDRNTPRGPYVVQVTARDSEGTLVETNITLEVNPLADNEYYNPSYPRNFEVRMGDIATIPEPFETRINNATFRVDKEWATINNNGFITLNPGYEVNPGENNLRVTINYGDGSTYTADIKVNVLTNYGESNNIDYSDNVLTPRKNNVINPNGDIPRGTEFTIESKPDWVDSATIDSRTGVINAFPDITNENAGISGALVINMVFPDGTTDQAYVNVTMGETQAQKYEPSYPDTSIKPGEIGTISLDGVDNQDDVRSYSIVRQPDNWNVNVNQSNGNLQVGLPYPSQGGSLSVNISYMDGTSDIVNVRITNAPMFADEYSPSYGSTSIKPGSGGSLAINDDGASQNIESYTILNPNATWNPVVNNDGTIVIDNLPMTEEVYNSRGESTVFDVQINYRDRSSEIVKATFIVDSMITDQFDPTYSRTSINTVVDNIITLNSDDGAGNNIVSYELEDGIEGWDISVNSENGEIKLNSPAGLPVNSEHRFSVRVNYVDGSWDSVPVTVVVDRTMANKNPVTWESIAVRSDGGTSTKEVTRHGNGNGPKVTYESARIVDTELDGWVASVDSTSGTLTVNSAPNTYSGDTAKVEVTVSYPDGSTNVVTVPVTVVTNDAHAHDPLYANRNITYRDGEQPEFSIEQIGDRDIPTGTDFTVTHENTEKWVVTDIDQTNGNITIDPVNVSTGDRQQFNVVITYPDGSVDETTFIVRVVENLSELYNVAYPQDNEITINNSVVVLPDLSNEDVAMPPSSDVKFVIPSGSTPSGVSAQVTSDGRLSVLVGSGYTGEDNFTINMIAEYSDGSKSNSIPVSFVITSKMGESLQQSLKYDLTDITAGKPSKITLYDASGNIPTIPVGTTFDVDRAMLPKGWIASVNNNGVITFTPSADSAGKTHNLIVTATLSDGSTADFVAPVNVLPGETVVTPPGDDNNDDDQDSDNNNPGTSTPTPSNDDDNDDVDNDDDPTSGNKNGGNNEEDSFNVTQQDSNDAGDEDKDKSTLAKTGADVNVVAGGLLASIITGLLGFFGLRRRK